MKLTGMLFTSVSSVMYKIFVIIACLNQLSLYGQSRDVGEVRVTMEQIQNRCMTLTGADGTTVTIYDIVEFILGPGISYSNVTYQGILGDASDASIGLFLNGDCVPLEFEEGIILSSGTVANIMGPNIYSDISAELGLPGDADLNSLIPGYQTYDASWIEFDFIPEDNHVFIQYIFGSEEYNEYVNDVFNDVFGFFVNGENIALLPDTNIPVAINNVNNGYAPDGQAANGPCTNCEFYLDNANLSNPPFDIECDGMTTMLTATAEVIPGVANTIKLAIADAGDSQLDSWVLIKAGSFSTQDPVHANVVTADADQITANSALLGGEVIDDGDGVITERGIWYGTGPDPAANGIQLQMGSGLGAFSDIVTGLQPNTQYYFVAYAENEVGISFGDVKSFTTIGKPTVITSPATNISVYSAVIGGEVIDEGGTDVYKRGVWYGTWPDPAADGIQIQMGSELGPFSDIVSGLQPNTQYYFVAFAENEVGISFGDVKSFTTIGKPTVITSPATNISAYSAVIGGEVIDEGGTDVYERGVWYGTGHNPPETGTKIIIGEGLGGFTETVYGLSSFTNYYVAAYAINSVGTSFGEVRPFTTLPELPEVITLNARDIDVLSAIIAGEMLCNGGMVDSKRGFYWSEHPEPGNSGNEILIGTGEGYYDYKLAGLQPGTRYFFQAFAENYSGRTFGNVKHFKTKEELLFIPNAFMPGSTIEDNKTFKPVFNLAPQTYQLNIYNRWGTMVFSTNVPDKGWDGKDNGSELPAGGYIFHLEYLTNQGNPKKYSGIIMLIR